ncbi:MAG TPA: CHAP domain-containing protein [Galbitalea sp.]|nr:CHAP domain-containing protein [Galbitalea sp.]
MNSSANSLGGSSFYSSCSGAGGVPELWCADFAKWVWANNGVNVAGITAGAASFITAAGSNGSTVHTNGSYAPQVGDAAVFDWNGGSSAEHVGIVVQVNGDGSLLLENGDFNGNQSSTNAYFAETSKVVPGTISAGNAHPGGSGFGMTISAFVTPNGLGGGGGSSTPPQPNTYPTLGTANIRSAPSTSASILNTVAQGTELVINCYENGTTVSGTSIWDHLASGGFISDSLLLTGSANPVVSACSSPSNTYPTWENGYVRTLSSELASAIRYAPTGTQLTIDCYVVGEDIESTTIWDHVTSGGFISDAHLLTGSAGAVVPLCPAGILHGPFPTFENASVYSQPTSASTLLASYGVGQYLTVDCYLNGPDVDGTTIWDHIAGLGFVSDSVVLTGSATPVVNGCVLSQLAPVPSISGAAAEGSTLTAVPGEWAPAPVTLSYRWLANGSAIAGATHSSLTLGSTQLGKTISVAVTGAASGFANYTSTSDSTSAVLASAPSTSPTPTITGSVRVGATLTAHAGYWPAPVTPKYQWFAGEHPIASATHSTLVVPASAYGHHIWVQVTRATGGAPSVLVSARTDPAALGVLTTTPHPTITGYRVVGHYLYAVTGTWQPAGITFTYKWYANGVAIAGATASSLGLKSAQDHRVITVAVEGHLPDYKGVTELSAGTTPIT